MLRTYVMCVMNAMPMHRSYHFKSETYLRLVKQRMIWQRLQSRRQLFFPSTSAGLYPHNRLSSQLSANKQIIIQINICHVVDLNQNMYGLHLYSETKYNGKNSAGDILNYYIAINIK